MKYRQGKEKPLHIPVLYNQVLNVLRPQENGLYIDGTLGFGGHAEGILDSSSPGGHLLAMDVDLDALEYAKKRLVRFGSRVTIVHASYTTMEKQIAQLGWASVNGIVLDLGVSSYQLDQPHRGFSFQSDGPLDMRFDPESILTASEIVNEYPVEEISRVLTQFGEEANAKNISRAIVKSRPISSTKQLTEVILGVSKYSRTGIHPATKTFQALRIAVNQEIDNLKEVLPAAVRCLLPGGRLVVLSFHSLEDRVVKNYFRGESQGCICPREVPVCVCDHKPVVKQYSSRPIRAGHQDIILNPRARSVRLRAVEKLAVA